MTCSLIPYMTDLNKNMIRDRWNRMGATLGRWSIISIMGLLLLFFDQILAEKQYLTELDTSWMSILPVHYNNSYSLLHGFQC